MNENLVVLAEMAAQPGKAEDLKQQLMRLVEPTRKEEGCLRYDLHAGLSDGERFLFYEIWTSQEALDRHMQTPHFLEFKGAADKLLAAPPRVVLFLKIA